MRPTPRPSKAALTSTLPAAALLTAAIASAATARADVVFADSTFNLANYSASPTYQDPGATLAYSSTAGTLTLTTSVSTPNLLQQTALALVNDGFLIDPSKQGPIASIDASVYKDLSFAGGPGTSSSPLGNTFHPTIEQNGVFYVASIPGPGLTGPGDTGWNLLSTTGLVAADFTSFNFSTDSYGTAHPDFAGNPLLFGLTQLTGIDWYTPSSITASYEDLTLDVHGPVAVPEPATIMLLAAGLIGVAGAARRQRRPCPRDAERS